MLVSCASCNGLHNRGEKCFNKLKRKRNKQITPISKFRNTSAWQKKRLEIKTRDKFLCQYCLLEKKYNFNELEVHHIIPLNENFQLKLENSNLVTLCHNCHFLAENNEIKADLLTNIAIKNVYTF
jgi:5-methylcytosine-specific restriction enzyme A